MIAFGMKKFGLKVKEQQYIEEKNINATA